MDNRPAYPKTITFRELLSNDDIAGIPLNIRKAEVIDFFGKPSSQDDFPSGITIFRFGSYELSFFDDTPMYLMNDSLVFTNTRHFQNHCIKIDPWIFDQEHPLSKDDTKKHLDRIGARYSIVIWNEREAIQMDNGVLLDFGPDLDDQHIVCTAIWLCFPKFPPKLRYIGR